MIRPAIVTRLKLAGLAVWPALLALLLFLPVVPLAAQTAPEKASPEYLGSELCASCHEEISVSFAADPHNKIETDARSEWRGKVCESCHGPGAAHAESMGQSGTIVRPSEAELLKSDARCLGCHINEPTHVGRIQGGHARNQIACATCHPVHAGGAGGELPRNRRETTELCAGCHTNIITAFQRPHTHRLTEGAMTCTDCHNPHGTIFQRRLRADAGNEPGCLRCHGNYRGPFVFEHAPVHLEGCTSCHEPHGSSNPRMLIRHEVRLVCLECHSKMFGGAQGAGGALGGIPTGIHNVNNPRYRNCTICHVKIHGSQVNRDFLR